MSNRTDFGALAVPPKATVHVHAMVQSTDERAGRDCQGGSTVVVYEHARDMRGGK